MTAQTVQTVGAPTLPRVNLMPPEIAEAARFRQLQLAMGAAVLVSAVAVAGLYMNARSSASSAQSQLQTTQGQHSELQSKLNSLSTVKATYAEVQTKQHLLSEAMGSEIRWSYVLNDLSLRIPSNVWLTAVQATETTGGSTTGSTTGTSTSTATSSAAAPGTYGTVAFNGVALAHDDVAKWLDALAQERGFTQASFSTSTEDAIGSRIVYDFGTSVVLNSKALSNRYVQKASS